MKALEYSYLRRLWMHISLIVISIYQPALSDQQETIQAIINAIDTLPQAYQPSNIKDSLSRMLAGQAICLHVLKGQYYEALHLTDLDSTQARIVQQGLNASPDKFWLLICKNQKIQTGIEQANISFTRENCQSPEYQMLFRCTYIKTTLENEDIMSRIQKAYQQAIINLQWFLYSQAILQDHIFAQGVLTIPDPNLYVFSFLDGYAEWVAPRYRLYTHLHPHSLWQTKAYSKKSTFFHHKKLFHDANFGIDFYNSDNKPNYVLPNNCSHLVFGALDNSLTCIAWHEIGTSINFKERNFSALKAPVKTLTQQKISPHLVRTDKVPQDVHLQFKSLFNHSLNRHQSSAISKDGISAMITMLETDAQNLLYDFLSKRKKYSSKVCKLRRGNEIIVLPSAFKHLV